MRSIQNNRRFAAMKQSVIGYGLILITIVGIMWMVEIVDIAFFAGNLDHFGIQPRSWTGLRNILFAPFLHRGVGHLFANTLPFIVLGGLVMLRNFNDFVAVSIITGLVSGLGIWLFGGSNSIHVGMSGVIFGFMGYLLARGYYERSFVSMALAAVTVILYGTMLFGILPLNPSVSWLGHLFGFLGGILAANILSARSSRRLSAPQTDVGEPQ